MFNHRINRSTSLSKFTAPMSILAGAFSILFATQAVAFEIEVSAKIADSDSTLMGVNHIALSVRDLDASLAFYQSATGFEVVRREIVRSSSAADKIAAVGSAMFLPASRVSAAIGLPLMLVISLRQTSRRMSVAITPSIPAALMIATTLAARSESGLRGSPMVQRLAPEWTITPGLTT